MKTLIHILLFTLFISCSSEEEIASENAETPMAASETTITAATEAETAAQAEIITETEAQAETETETVQPPVHEPRSAPEIRNKAIKTALLTEGSSPAATSQKVQTLTQEMCAISRKEINCYKKIVLKKDIATLSGDTKKCFQDFGENFGRLSQKMTQNTLSESEKSDVNRSLFVWKNLLKKFNNNQAQCKLQNHETPEKLFTYYDSIIHDYSRDVQGKLCNSNL